MDGRARPGHLLEISPKTNTVQPKMTGETGAVREVTLDPHVAWAIACLLAGLVAAVAALVIDLAERRR